MTRKASNASSCAGRLFIVSWRLATSEVRVSTAPCSVSRFLSTWWTLSPEPSSFRTSGSGSAPPMPAHTETWLKTAPKAAPRSFSPPNFSTDRPSFAASSSRPSSAEVIRVLPPEVPKCRGPRGAPAACAREGPVAVPGCKEEVVRSAQLPHGPRALRPPGPAGPDDWSVVWCAKEPLVCRVRVRRGACQASRSCSPATSRTCSHSSRPARICSAWPETSSRPLPRK